MEENFINKAKIIINELNKADEMPSTVGWNDKRVSSKKEEKHYENTREGEILEKIDETSDISKRKEFINELREVRIQKKVILKNELNAELDSVKEKLNKESERLDRKIQKAKDLNKRVKRAIANNNALLKNRDENSLVYKAAKEENEKAMERKNKMPQIIKNLKEERKELNKKIDFYNSIDIEKDGISKLENLIHLQEEKIKQENISEKHEENKEKSQKEINKTEVENKDNNKEKSKESENYQSKDNKEIEEKLQKEISTIMAEDKQEKESLKYEKTENAEKKEGILKRMLNKIKSSKIVQGISNFFKRITSGRKMLPEKINLGSKKENAAENVIDRMQKAAEEKFPKRDFVEKIDNSDNHIENNAKRTMSEEEIQSSVDEAIKNWEKDEQER